MKVEILRKKYPRFLYKDFEWILRGNNLEILFKFELPPNLSFQPKIKIKNVKKERLKRIKKEVLKNLIFHLGLSEIPSYWKVTCSPRIEIEKGELTKEQIKWWENFLIKGMGQYFFENKINFQKKDFLEISIEKEKKEFISYLEKRNAQKENLDPRKFLIALGEGKDSILTLELFKKFQKKFPQKKIKLNCFIVNPNQAHFKILKKAQIKHPLIVQREIDKKLFFLNQKNFLNGHVPITGCYSFLGILVSFLFDFGNLVFSNERSAEEGNLEYRGEIINHQYSKTFEFEKKLNSYLKKYLIADLNYFSFLRPLYEIQIAQLFSHFSQYFPLFLSCNQGKKIKSITKSLTWCQKCPKCFFVFLILYPFLKKEELKKIFSQNLFEKKEFSSLIEKLIAKKAFKPFECLGTKKETLVAFYLAIKKEKKSKKTLPFLLKYFEKKIAPKYPEFKKLSLKFLSSWGKHNLPSDLASFLRKSIIEKSLNF